MKRAADQKTTEPAGNQQGVGALLRATRLRHGLELEDVASILRIRGVYIEAIEDSRYTDLPGSTYAVGFIRSYSEHLGLDAEEIIRRFKVEAESLKDASLAFPEPIPETGIPSGAILLTAVLFAGLAYGAWMVATSDDNILGDLIQPVPEEIATNTEENTEENTEQNPEEAPTPVATGTPEPEQTAEAPAEEPTAAETPVAEDAEPEKTSTADAEESAVEEPAAAPETETSDEQPVEEAEVEVSAEETTAEEAAPEETAAEETTAEETGETSSPVSEPAETETVAEAESEPVVAEEATPVETVAEQTAPAEQQEAGLADPAEPEPAPDATSPEPTEAVTEEEPAEANAAVASDETEAETETEVAEAAPLVRGAVDGPSRISLVAEQATWMEIRDAASNDVLFSGILSEGQTYKVPDRGGIEMVTGNAGGLTITVDGNAIAPIGPPGAVRRGVKLEPTALLER